MKNRGSIPIFTNLLGVHPGNIHTKFSKPIQRSERGSQKSTKVHNSNDDNNDDDGHKAMSDQEPTRWQHNRIYPYPTNPCGYTYDSICHLQISI